MSCIYKTASLLLVYFTSGLLLVKSGSLDGLVVVVLSQSNSLHVSRAEGSLQELEKDLHALHVEDFTVVASHQLKLLGEAWTIVPLFEPLAAYEGKWFLFLAEQTQVNFTVLESVLASFDPSKELFLGHGLQDKEHTITHHFAPPQSLLYPYLPSGFLLSRPTLVRASKNVRNFKESFNIDAQFELALFLKFHRLTKKEAGPAPPTPPSSSTLLTHLPSLCLAPPPFPVDGSCATVHEERIPECKDGDEVTSNQVHFAVKTCSKYHDSRLPVVHKTWARDVGVASITYYSDREDKKYSTVYSGLPNTDKGHCGKTIAIIRQFYALSKTTPLKWLVIADDDTLLSVPRLLHLLRCYDHGHPVLLGEAYGYEAHSAQGYTYITGGGGMVLSLQAVTSFVESGLDCPAPDHPDDMYLGTISKILRWDIVHSPLFHQSQPPSFPAEVLQLQESISFHRHSPLDPLQVYANYLQDHTHKAGKRDISEEAHHDYKSKIQDRKTEL